MPAAPTGTGYVATHLVSDVAASGSPYSTAQGHP